MVVFLVEISKVFKNGYLMIRSHSPPNHQTTKPPNHQTTKPPNHQDQLSVFFLQKHQSINNNKIIKMKRKKKNRVTLFDQRNSLLNVNVFFHQNKKRKK